ncbi:MAG: NYN domain-containing protein, partial [Chloroflexi bacterium]|nr:NYN domain-containing protein [Chloroflexota bacterium]
RRSAAAEGETNDDDDDDEKPRVRRTRRGGRGQTRSEDGDKPARAARPARSRSTAAEESDDAPKRTRRPAASEGDADADGDEKPRVRRSRRGGRGRTRSEDDAPASESEAPEAKDEPEDTAEVEEKPKPRTRRAAAPAADSDLSALQEAVARQEVMLAELREGIEHLGTRIVSSGYRPRVAVFVDVPNLIYGYEGEGSLNMGKLLKMITEGRDLVRATAYSPVSDDPREPVEQQRFVAPFVPHEYRIVTKPLKRFSDGSIKGNFDVEMAVDMVMMADRVDVICIVSGDADFARAVEVVQQKGVRVEVVAFAGSTSIEMRAIADHYFELDRTVKQIL